MLDRRHTSTSTETKESSSLAEAARTVGSGPPSASASPATSNAPPLLAKAAGAQSTDPIVSSGSNANNFGVGDVGAPKQGPSNAARLFGAVLDAKRCV